jgi:uncharacterized protein (TIGR03435 family)
MCARWLLKANAVLLLCAIGGCGQTPDAGLKFEVASVKPSPDPSARIAAGMMPGRGTNINPTRFDMAFASLLTLIGMAYKVDPFQIAGPDWMATDRFDIVAGIPEGATRDQIPQMLQALLAERFKLAVHRELGDRPVYALVVGRDGPKLKETPVDAATSDVAFPNGLGGRSIAYVEGEAGQFLTYSRLNDGWVFDALKISMPELALRLMAYVDLPVVDQTGLKGTYQIVSMPLPGGPHYKQESGRAGIGMVGDGSASPEASAPSGVSVFTSVEKLGIRLTRAKAPIEHIVVDRLEKTPTEN